MYFYAGSAYLGAICMHFYMVSAYLGGHLYAFLRGIRIPRVPFIAIYGRCAIWASGPAVVIVVPLYAGVKVDT